MKISKFNYELQHQSKYYVYNTLTDAIFSLRQPLTTETLNMFSEDEQKTMLAHGLLVDEFDENLVADSLLKQTQRDLSFSFINHVIIAPTLLCNARCFYCYEEGVSQMTMSSEIINQTIDFIKRNTGSNKSLKISWFGGEPTLALAAVKQISNALINEHYEIRASMITNGSKLTSDTVQTLKACYINHIQLSIDGFADIYTQRKNYVDGTTFDDIIHGIKNCLNSGISVSLRLNIDRSNLNSIYKLIEHITTHCHSPLLKAYPAPLFGKNVGEKLYQDGFETNSIIVDMLTYLDERNLLDEKCKLTSGILKMPCMAHKTSTIVIDARGDLYKCEHDVGKHELSIGSVFQKDFPNLNGTTDCIIPLKTKFNRCYECEVLPKCMGGCDAVRRDGELPCGMIKQIVEYYILQHIDNDEA